MATSKPTQTSIELTEFKSGRVDFCLVGLTPIILNRLSEKAKRELFMPKGRKTAADKAGTLKHHPFEEFRDAPYLNPDKNAPTYIEHLSTAFKAAIRGAGVDMPGSSKAQLGRLLWAEGERVSIYGSPKLFMAITRSADMNKTPDIRTRAIIENWACRFSVSFVEPVLNVKVVANLLSAAGLIQGVGDWRPEKGSGNYGQFKIVTENDAQFKAITKIGWKQQFAAMQNPVAYDHETEELLEWFKSEVDRRGLKVAGGAK